MEWTWDLTAGNASQMEDKRKNNKSILLIGKWKNKVVKVNESFSNELREKLG